MRNIQIVIKSIGAFLRLGLSLIVFKDKNEKLNITGKKLRIYFEDLGGIFIKFGQIISLRMDMLPEEICLELRKLLDSVPAFPYEDVKIIFKEEFGNEPEKYFKKFQQKPIASASLGQVHKAQLRNGDWVAVKVQRPDIKNKTKSDLALLIFFTNIIDHIPFFPIKLKPIVDEFKVWIEEELDYRHEANNLEGFYKFKSHILPIFDIPLKMNSPKVYRELSSDRVLTMEFIEGISLNKIINICRDKKSEEYKSFIEKGYEIKKILKNINLMQLKQIYIDGYFNADPHPANIIVRPDNEIYYIDFGLIGVLNEKQKTAISRFLRSSSILDGDAAYEAALVMFDIENDKKKTQLKEAIHEMFDYLKKQRLLENSYSKASRDSILYFSKIIYKLRLDLPIDISKAMRCVMTSDGIVHTLAPTASVEEITQDLFKTTLVATWLGIKRKMTKRNVLRLIIKAINIIESEMLLDD